MRQGTGRIVLLTGAPGTGKTTSAAMAAQKSDGEKSVHLHTDDFYHYLSKGAIPPHLPESNEQNAVVTEAFLAAAQAFARGGYDVLVDGIIGPWFLSPWKRAASEGYEIHYIVLRAAQDETLRRAVARSKLDREANTELVEVMWKQFCSLGEYERYVLDTTEQSVEETVASILDILRRGTHLL